MDYRWLRKIRLHPRERVFWWRLCLDAIPTLAWLHRRGLTENFRCPWGCEAREDTEHLTTSCEALITVFNILNGWGFQIPQFHNWNSLLDALKTPTQTDVTWIRAYCYTVYHIWRNRLAKTHGQPIRTPTVLAASILAAFTRTYNSATRGQWAINQRQTLQQPPCWLPPPPGWLKINVDASILGGNDAAIAAVIRDEHGNWCAAMGRRLHESDVARAELLAATSFQQIVKPWMLEVHGIIIEGDNSNVIQFLQSSMHQHHWQHRPHDAPDIAWLLAFHTVFFNHVPRGVNHLADFCVSLARSSNFLWHSDARANIPLAFIRLVERDKGGIG